MSYSTGLGLSGKRSADNADLQNNSSTKYINSSSHTVSSQIHLMTKAIFTDLPHEGEFRNRLNTFVQGLNNLEKKHPSDVKITKILQEIHQSVHSKEKGGVAMNGLIPNKIDCGSYKNEFGVHGGLKSIYNLLNKFLPIDEDMDRYIVLPTLSDSQIKKLQQLMNKFIYGWGGAITEKDEVEMRKLLAQIDPHLLEFPSRSPLFGNFLIKARLDLLEILFNNGLDLNWALENFDGIISYESIAEIPKEVPKDQEQKFLQNQLLNELQTALAQVKENSPARPLVEKFMVYLKEEIFSL